MNKIKRVKTNGTPDNRFLERDVLERELIRRDKQSLVSDCLKIFDTNTMIFEQVEAFKTKVNELERRIKEHQTEVERLKGRTLWAILNERIQWRIDRMKERRTQNPTL